MEGAALYTLSDVEQYCSSLADTYGDRVSFGRAEGASSQGKDIPLIEVAASGESQGLIYVTAGQHVSEPASVSAALDFLDTYLSDSVFEGIRERYSLVMAPVVNADRYDMADPGKFPIEKDETNASGQVMNSGYSPTGSQVPEEQAVLETLTRAEKQYGPLALAFDIHETSKSGFSLGSMHMVCATDPGAVAKAHPTGDALTAQGYWPVISPDTSSDGTLRKVEDERTPFSYVIETNTANTLEERIAIGSRYLQDITRSVLDSPPNER